MRGIRLRAVLFVADDGMAEIRQLHADLMAPSGFQFQRDERPLRRARQHSIAREGVARLLTRRRAPHAIRTRLIEMRIKRAGVALELSFHDRFVAFRDRFPAALQRLFGFRCFRENHQTRSLLVEPMHNPNAIARVILPLPQIIGELEIRGLLAFREARDAEEIFRFVDYDQGRVLVVDLHAGSKLGLRNREPIRANRHDITFLQWMIELRDRPPVHRH